MIETPATVEADVHRALDEDVGSGDLSAAAIPAERMASASVIAREPAIVCGRPWFDTAFASVDDAIEIDWHAAEGEAVGAGQTLCSLHGPARGLCTAERTALNFLQLLSGVATATRTFVDAIADTGVVILDTRKTLPGLRAAQKYAVTVGGGRNHRFGLHDQAMLKENHLAAAGGIEPAIAAVREQHPQAPLTVEVETLEQLEVALAAGADRLLLDNFELDALREAVRLNDGRAVLEASGGLELNQVRMVAETGIDCISVGALTKHVRALDLSLRFH